MQEDVLCKRAKVVLFSYTYNLEYFIPTKAMLQDSHAPRSACKRRSAGIMLSDQVEQWCGETLCVCVCASMCVCVFLYISCLDSHACAAVLVMNA